MKDEQIFDTAIIGGGLAGLSLAILQAKAGRSVILFEKNDYPQHKVCGEYISLESWDFIEKLGVPLSKLDLPIISNLQVSSPRGTFLETKLDLGGFGISRYLLDKLLADTALECGVKILTKSLVKNVLKEDIASKIILDKQSFFATHVIGAYGKRSNLDIVWNRPFIHKNRTSLNQYIGVKYHIKYDFPKDMIALHNFEDGYCGISAVEEGLHCLCYLTTKKNLKKAGNDIKIMEREILSKNPFLKDIFDSAEFTWANPEVISQVSFEKKEIYANGVTMTGDAAGMIAPLCGNGMSMAMHGAFLIHNELMGKPVKSYADNWKKNFKLRLIVGRTIQRFFGGIWSTELVIRALKLNRRLLDYVITLTHGQKFG